MKIAFRCVMWFLCAWAPLAYAEKYALVVGINHYPNLPAKYQLEGAVNDANRTARVLPKFGFAANNIHLMTDESAQDSLPTRAHIVTALASLVERAKRDDVVFLYFAAHGSQQPVFKSKKENEADDLDEILLPSDVKRWTGQQGGVENAIVDDEFDAVFSKLREKGAFVVATFDTCHAGSMARGEDEDDKARFVPLDVLGIPAELQTLAVHVRGDARGASVPRERLIQTRSKTSGGFVALYAAQSDQKTKEIRDTQGVKRGVFSYHLLNALEKSGEKSEASYRQVAEDVLVAYKNEHRYLASPQFEGEGLDYLVFNPDHQKKLFQWQVFRSAQGFAIPAGYLHQFGKGSSFTLHRHAYDEEVLGTASAEAVQANQTQLRLGVSAAALPEVFFARLKKAKLDASVVVGARPQDKLANQILSQLSQEQNAGGIVWKSEVADADYVLISDTDRHNTVCLVARADLVAKTRKCANPYTRVRVQAKSIRAHSAVNALAQKLLLPHRLLKTTQSLNQEELLNKVNLELRKISSDTKLELPVTRLGVNNIPTVVHAGDKLELLITNTSQRALDLTILVLDSAYGVKRLFPTLPGANRIEAGAQFPLRLRVTPKPLGVEDVLVFVSEVHPLQMTDFSFLTQDAFEPTSLISEQESESVRSQSDSLQALSTLLARTRSHQERGQVEQALPRTAIAKLTWVTR